jgi:hypothetical protein
MNHSGDIERAKIAINTWCDEADKRVLFPHRAHFWNARDVIENQISIDECAAMRALIFIRNCKPSADRDIIISILEERIDYSTIT